MAPYSTVLLQSGMVCGGMVRELVREGISEEMKFDL